MIYNRETIKDLPIVISLAPPVISGFIKNGKRYGVYTGKNGRWVEITEDVTLDDISSRWKRWTKTLTPEETKVKKTIDKAKKLHQTEWKVPGSKGNEYTVELKGSTLTCECVGFGFRRKCKHVEQIKEKIWNTGK